MDALIGSLANLPQWMHIAAGVLLATAIAILVMAEDL
jgi:hypothetical protein